MFAVLNSSDSLVLPSSRPDEEVPPAAARVARQDALQAACYHLRFAADLQKLGRRPNAALVLAAAEVRPLHWKATAFYRLPIAGLLLVAVAAACCPSSPQENYTLGRSTVALALAVE